MFSHTTSTSGVSKKNPNYSLYRDYETLSKILLLSMDLNWIHVYTVSGYHTIDDYVWVRSVMCLICSKWVFAFFFSAVPVCPDNSQSRADEKKTALYSLIAVYHREPLRVAYSPKRGSDCLALFKQFIHAET